MDGLGKSFRAFVLSQKIPGCTITAVDDDHITLLTADAKGVVNFYRFDDMPEVVELSVIDIDCPDDPKFFLHFELDDEAHAEELFNEIRQHIGSDIQARSFRLNSSRIELSHPLVQKIISLGGQPFGSPTLSDQALMPFPSLKMGPGQSSRSHTADEFVEIQEIRQAIEFYLKVLL